MLPGVFSDNMITQEVLGPIVDILEFRRRACLEVILYEASWANVNSSLSVDSLLTQALMKALTQNMMI